MTRTGKAPNPYLIEPASTGFEYWKWWRLRTAPEGVNDQQEFDRYLAFLTRMKEGSPGGVLVPETTFWLIDRTQKGLEEIVGIARLRPYINEALEREGGHVGYEVPFAWRGRGYATILLFLARKHPLFAGRSFILVTCDEDNIASRRVIEKNEGQLIGSGLSSYSHKIVLRFNVPTRE